MLLRHRRWSSAGILLKFYLYSILCLLVRLVKWVFLKIQLSIFAETNVTLGGTYKLARRLTVLFFPTEILHETLLPLPIHWFQGEKLTLVYLFWMQTVGAVRTPLFCLLLQILSFKSAWGHCSEEQWYSEKHIPQKADIMQVTDTVEMDSNLFLPLKSAGKHFQWRWKEDGICQCCSFLVFFFLPHLSLNGKS